MSNNNVLLLDLRKLRIRLFLYAENNFYLGNTPFHDQMLIYGTCLFDLL